ncbi:chitin-binding protein [Ochrobactrum anthropi]|uniref:lytic polysaccharide monooxygenase n=1 Tax=Brucella anthropi TaxID=529 RepID=UPI0015F96C76|nr:lytic polysaccharide monooxygenase [Brucella anthropi]MBA8862893.1 chitin-binding protein [Brucella anthropi]
MTNTKNSIISRSHNQEIDTRHGHVFQPASRAYFAWQDGLIDTGALNQREAGKFFPATSGGLRDAFAPDDQTNATPPPDGKIASAGQLTGQVLDQAGSNWKKHDVRSSQILDVSWHFTANHVTRRWNYFMTKENWDPSRPLSRDQFESEPFYTVQINLQPFWSHSNSMKPSSPTVHSVPLPERQGYQVLLAVWEVADTANAFYQIVDLNFVTSSEPENRPTIPKNLRVVTATDVLVKLQWDSSQGEHAIESYRITRNGSTTVDVSASEVTWTDNSIQPETSYTYFVCAVDTNGGVSAPSTAIEITTMPSGGIDAPPSAPSNLHSMRETPKSVSLMWSKSVSPSTLTNYIVYCDGREVQRVSASETSCEATGLTPSTAYRFFVAALDSKGRMSVPSNVLSVKTNPPVESGLPEWKLNGSYKTNDIVSHNGAKWRCLQAHIAYSEAWAPGASDSAVLWQRA